MVRRDLDRLKHFGALSHLTFHQLGVAYCYDTEALITEGNANLSVVN